MNYNHLNHARIHGDCDQCLLNVRMAVSDRIQAERERQEKKWGVQDHSPYTWLVILMEEVGESAEAALKMSFDGDPTGKMQGQLEEELIQVAAVASAAAECLIRGEWRQRKSHLQRERMDIVHEEMARMSTEEKGAAVRVLEILTGGSVKKA